MENQNMEYKDYSNVTNSPSEISKVKFKLIKEICAFANSGGGKIFVGKSDDGNEVTQPKHIVQLLDNDSLSSSINMCTDNLVVLQAINHCDIIEIKINNSPVIISLVRDSSAFSKGDIFVRENAECKKVTPTGLKRLMKQKELLSVDSKIMKLEKMVHKKFILNKNHAKDLNIFDSMRVTYDSSKHSFDQAKYVFDIIVLYEYSFGLSFHYTKYFSIQDSIDSIAIYQKNHEKLNLGLLNHLKENKSLQQRLIKGATEKVINSKEFSDYIDFED
jgi:hypothetical protein